MSTKKFSAHCFKENDTLGKNAGLLHLFTHHPTPRIWVNMGRTGVDINFENVDKTIGSLECEVKRGWAGGPFPYPTIQALSRKRKFFEAGADWLLLSNNLQDYLIISGKDILESPLQEVRNQYCLTGELFYQVPSAKATFYKFGTPLVELPLDCSYCASTAIDASDKNRVSCGLCGAER